MSEPAKKKVSRQPQTVSALGLNAINYSYAIYDKQLLPSYIMRVAYKETVTNVSQYQYMGSLKATNKCRASYNPTICGDLDTDANPAKKAILLVGDNGMNIR